MKETLTEQERQFIIDRIESGEPIPEDFKYKLFPSSQKEYELNYAGKMRKQDVLRGEDGVLPVPLQIEKIYNGDRELFDDGWRNLIVFGDNLQFLKTCYQNEDELIKNQVRGKVKLVYIDPPFATASDFTARKGQKGYTDKKKDSDFIEFIRRRLIVAKELLAPDANIIVHLDSKKSHYIKLVLDEIFGENNFCNEVIWNKGREGGSSRSHANGSVMPTEYQNILIYSVNKQGRYWKPILGPYKQSTVSRIEKDDVGWYYTRGRMGRKPAEWEAQEKKGLKSYVSNDVSKTKEEILSKITTVGAEFVSIGDVWNNDLIKFSQTTDYPTEKPEQLLEKFILAATKENDLVMDFFGGSGTTAAVAEKLGRKWIVCDIGKLSFYTIQKRIISIQNSKDLLSPTKKYNRQAKSFVTVNIGHYDLAKLFELGKDKYVKFVLGLFEIDPYRETKKIKGYEISGERNGSYCLVWEFWKYKEDANVDLAFLEDLHESIGSRIGKRFYIIAPANAIDFFSDYHEIGDTRYYFLKVPYQIIQELHKQEFKKFRQPQSKTKINDLDDAVGFHFKRDPEVESSFVNGELIIKRFNSNFTEEGTDREMDNFESLAMVIVDLDFNGKEFAMSQHEFAADLIKSNKKQEEDQDQEEDIQAELKQKSQLSIPLKPYGDRICVKYIDIYGNEFTEDFKAK